MKQATSRLFEHAPTAGGLPWAVLDVAQQAAMRFKPPQWLEQEIHNRVVLLLNHVLQSEPEAMQRLARHSQKTIRLQLKPIEACLRITAVGLLECVAQQPNPDLSLELTSDRWSEVAQSLASGDQPDVHLYGDVMLAAEIGWLREHVRWDVEDDLARIMGNAPATLIIDTARRTLDALRAFVVRAGVQAS